MEKLPMIFMIQEKFLLLFLVALNPSNCYQENWI